MLYAFFLFVMEVSNAIYNFDLHIKRSIPRKLPFKTNLALVGEHCLLQIFFTSKLQCQSTSMLLKWRGIAYI